MQFLRTKTFHKLTILSLAIMSASQAYALNCSFSSDGKTQTCTTDGEQEANRFVDQNPSYGKLILDNANLVNPTGVIFGPGPAASSNKYGDLTAAIVNSTITANTYADGQWAYGVYNGVGASSVNNATDKAIITIDGSTINVNATDSRTNAAVAEAGFSGTGIGTAIVSVKNSKITVNNSDTVDRGSSGVGATANYIAEVTTDANSSISTVGSYTPAIAVTGDNAKTNPLDLTLNNGHQFVNNAAILSTNGNYSNGIQSTTRADGDIIINNSGSITTLGNNSNGIAVDTDISGSNKFSAIAIENTNTITTKGSNSNGINIDLTKVSSANIINKGIISTQNAGSGININAAGTININNTGTINGGRSGISVANTITATSPQTINNTGTITADSDLAISMINMDTATQASQVNNMGQLYGYVNLADTGANSAAKMNNSNYWLVRNNTDTSGTVTSNFGTASQQGSLNNTGTIEFDSSVTTANFDHVDVTNSGSFAVSDNAKNYTPMTVNFKGNYIGQGGSLAVRTDAQHLTSDQYHITGDATGKSSLYVKLINALNAQKTGKNGIEVVTVDGANNLNLTLGRPVTAGMYEYQLFKNGNNNWALGTTQTLINPAVGAYLANQTAATQMFTHTLYDREGQATFTNGKSTAEARPFWIRTEMDHGSYRSVNNSLSNRNRTYKIEFGSDLAVLRLLEGNFHLGVMGGYGDFKNTSRSRASGTKIDGRVHGYNGGVYGTWFQNDDGALGLYVDTWTQYGLFRNKVEGNSMDSTKHYTSSVWSSSIEMGYGLSLGKSASYEYIATPQVQLTYNLYDADNQRDTNNLHMTANDASGVNTRVGMRFSARGVDKPRIEPYLELNWLNSNAHNSLKFNGTKLHDGVPDNKAEAKLGLQGHVTDRLSIGGQVAGQWGNQQFNQYQATLNVSYKW